MQSKTKPTEALDRLAYSPKRAATATDTSRTRIFQAIKDGELTARRPSSRKTIIEASELAEWLKNLPPVETKQPATRR